MALACGAVALWRWRLCVRVALVCGAVMVVCLQTDRVRQGVCGCCAVVRRCCVLLCAVLALGGWVLTW